MRIAKKKRGELVKPRKLKTLCCINGKTFPLLISIDLFISHAILRQKNDTGNFAHPEILGFPEEEESVCDMVLLHPVLLLPVLPQVRHLFPADRSSLLLLFRVI